MGSLYINVSYGVMKKNDQKPPQNSNIEDKPLSSYL